MSVPGSPVSDQDPIVANGVDVRASLDVDADLPRGRVRHGATRTGRRSLLAVLRAWLGEKEVSLLVDVFVLIPFWWGVWKIFDVLWSHLGHLF